MTDLYQIFLAAGLPSAAVLYLLLFPEKFERVVALVGRLIYTVSSSFPRVRDWADKQTIAFSVQSSINAICEQLNRRAPGILPHTLKIQWVQPDELDSYIKQGQVVVRLEHFKNFDRNLVHATLSYLSVGLLPNAKVYMDKRLRRASEFKVAAAIFNSQPESGTFQYFVENELDPLLEKDNDFAKDWQMVYDIDAAGFFTRVFLREVRHIGEKLLRTVPGTPVREELRAFARFLQVIATKGLGEDVPLKFNGTVVRVAVVLVARWDVIQTHGVRPYLRRIELNSREGHEYIFVVGWGEEYAEKIKDIKDSIPSAVATVLDAYALTSVGRKATAALLVCQSNLTYLARMRELQHEVEHALRRVIPEIEAGQVQIASIARRRGVACKIAVRSPTDAQSSDPVAMCVGPNSTRLKKISEGLNGEYVTFVLWSDDPADFILNSLYPLKDYHVDSIEVDEEWLVANVKVPLKYGMQKAIGKGGINVGLASELTGYVINVEGPRSDAQQRDPEEELREVLFANIPELRNGELLIEGLARIRGIGAKVLVTWKDQEAALGKPPWVPCMGQNNDRQNSIRNDLDGELVQFHPFNSNPKELLALCLYPLQKNHIASIDLDYENKKAVVRLIEGAKPPDIWKGDFNMKLVRRLTGWKIVPA